MSKENGKKKKVTVADVYKLMVENSARAEQRFLDAAKRFSEIYRAVEVTQGQVDAVSLKIDEIESGLSKLPMSQITSSQISGNTVQKKDFRAKVNFCKFCQEKGISTQIVWPKPYTGGGPNNVDGTPHRCQTR